MFTGIIEQLGRVLEVSPRAVVIDALFELSDPVQIGESIAVDGCCLTAVTTNPLGFELSEETMRKTAFGELKVGALVNLERAMKVGSRFGGHLVQGHVDATGALTAVEESPQAHILRFRFSSREAKYVIEKGSITVNGISLTVVDLTDIAGESVFQVWIIPHTWSQTNLKELRIGSRVNLEFDMIAKYLERLLEPRGNRARQG